MFNGSSKVKNAFLLFLFYSKMLSLYWRPKEVEFAMQKWATVPSVQKWATRQIY